MPFSSSFYCPLSTDLEAEFQKSVIDFSGSESLLFEPEQPQDDMPNPAGPCSVVSLGKLGEDQRYSAWITWSEFLGLGVGTRAEFVQVAPCDWTPG